MIDPDIEARLKRVEVTADRMERLLRITLNIPAFRDAPSFRALVEEMGIEPQPIRRKWWWFW